MKYSLCLLNKCKVKITVNYSIFKSNTSSIYMYAKADVSAELDDFTETITLNPLSLRNYADFFPRIDF